MPSYGIALYPKLKSRISRKMFIKSVITIQLTFWIDILVKIIKIIKIVLREGNIVCTAGKVSVFGVFLVLIFPHSDWIWTRKTPNTDTIHAVLVDLLVKLALWDSVAFVEYFSSKPERELEFDWHHLWIFYFYFNLRNLEKSIMTLFATA